MRGLLATIRGLAVFVMLLASVATLNAQAPTPASEAMAEEAISRLRSPFCPGLMLEVCPSAAAGLLRDSIHVLASQGRTADEIEEWMLARHGEEWRAVPKKSGTGLWAWLVPPAALLLGGGYVMRRLHRERDTSERDPAMEDPIDDESRQRLAAAMNEWERSEAVGE